MVIQGHRKYECSECGSTKLPDKVTRIGCQLLVCPNCGHIHLIKEPDKLFKEPGKNEVIYRASNLKIIY